MRSSEGLAPSSAEFQEALRNVERETEDHVQTNAQLARNRERNLIRNSGQYWRALGLLQDSPGEIQLTDFGRRVADGLVSRAEFAAATIKSLTLPNRRLGDVGDARDWDRAGLRLKPLALLVDILTELRSRNDSAAFLTVDEVVKVVIPLAGDNRSVREIATALIEQRNGSLNTDNWPDCAPEANDRRMAGEFLLFLLHYGYCDRIGERFTLLEANAPAVAQIASIQVASSNPEEALPEIRNTNLPLFAERERRTVTVLTRPGQQRFRRELLTATGGRCLISGETLGEVLIAAHIIPVENGGTENVSNGLLLRTDLHILFDAGDLRIKPDGTITVSERMLNSVTYANLPVNVPIPGYVSREALHWRCTYY